MRFVLFSATKMIRRSRCDFAGSVSFWKLSACWLVLQASALTFCDCRNRNRARALDMPRNELIRPVHAEARRRRAAGFAVLTGGLLVVVATVSLFGGKHPAALANGSNSLGAVREAQSAAKNAESDVATFLAAMKAQRAVPKESDAHALDWNWAPELQRNKNIRNWVGSDWVKPLAGDREIERIAAPQFGAGKDRLAAARSSAGLASEVISGHSTDQLPHMPSLQPLHYFSGGKTAGSDDWNTR